MQTRLPFIHHTKELLQFYYNINKLINNLYVCLGFTTIRPENRAYRLLAGQNHATIRSGTSVISRLPVVLKVVLPPGAHESHWSPMLPMAGSDRL